MSRAFTKDRDDVPEPPVVAERSIPYHLSAAGRERLSTELAATTDERRRTELEHLLEISVVVEPPARPSRVGFGARVRVVGEGMPEREFTIVGDDEVAVAAGKIALTSPLAEALMGARLGSRVVWHRPVGDLTLRVTAIAYD